ncbi:MAG: porin [Nitrospirota bacterium]|nr:porin [Nitrospirota bacterium]
MKKYLVLVLTLIFVLSLAVAAFAEVKLSGDARVRGIWKNNYDMDTDADDEDDRYYDQRFRLKVVGDAGNGIEARARLEFANSAWGNGQATKDNPLVEYAYLHIPIASVTVDAGLKTRDYGYGFLTDMYDQEFETIEASMTFDTVTVTAFTDKVTDTRAAETGSDNLKDYDNYGLSVSAKVGEINIGALIASQKDARPATDVDGNIYDINASANINNIAIKAELAYLTGDINEDTEGNDPMGFFVSAAMPMGQINVHGAIAYAADGYTADDDFTPTVFIGTDQNTAALDFAATDDESSYAVVVGADYSVNDDLGVSAKLAYLSQDAMGVGGDDRTAIEFDAGLSYKIAANASYSLDFGYLSPSDWTAEDDAAIALAHKVQISF